MPSSWSKTSPAISRRGWSRFRRRWSGRGEVGFTVVSISLSLIAVFVPLIFMGGIVGRLFREFALTMTAAVAISLVISLTTTPMLAARIIRHEPEKEGRLFRTARRSFDWAQARYTRSLDWALDNRGAVLLLLVAAVALSMSICWWWRPRGSFRNRIPAG